MAKVQIFTDGSAQQNPGAGGWCAIVRQDGKNEKVLSGGATFATNYEMEIAPILSTLLSIDEPSSIHLITDNKDVETVIKNRPKVWEEKDFKVKGTNKPLEHPQLWKAYLAAAAEHTVTVEWKERNSTPELKRCDEIAKSEAERRRQ